MSEVEKILAEVRNRRPAGTRTGSRLALGLAGVGLIGSIAAGATLGISATASISRQGFGSPAPAAIVYESTAKYAPPSGKEMSALRPAVAGNAEAAPDDTTAPVEPRTYGALTELDTIPPPPSHWSADELANAEVWLTQQSIIADCMLQKGFEYEFSPWWTWPADYRPGGDGVEVEYDVEEGIALDGEPDRGLGDDYDWREAGCHGYAVHVTGMESAN